MRGAGRKPIAEEAIVAAAERLFAQYGIAQVSLRQIRQEAGSANNFAVQYHFRDRAGLVRAVYERRIPTLERRRNELFNEAKAAGRMHDPAALIEAIMRPMGEIRDDDGQRTYAGFQLKLYAVERDPTYEDAIHRPPITTRISTLLGSCLPHLPDEVFRYRLAGAGMVYLDAMVRLNEGVAPLDEAQMAQEALSLAVALVLAPYAGPKPTPATPAKEALAT